MSSLHLQYSDVYNAVARLLWKRDPSKWYKDASSKSTDEQTTIIKDIVSRGYRQFLYPVDRRTGSLHEWSFLKKRWTLNLISGAWQYALPADFSDMLANPIFDTNTDYAPPKKRDAEQILQFRSNSDYQDEPEFYAIVPVNYDAKTGTFYQIWFYPMPSESALLHIFYRIDPLKCASDTDYLIGGVKSTEAILENCYAVAEQQELNTIGIHTQLANDLTQRLIIADDVIQSDTLGNLYGREAVWPKSMTGEYSVLTNRFYEDETGSYS